MARKVFLSFLGTTNYSSSKYIIDGEKSIETRFVQIASFKFHCSDFGENDKIFIFTSPTAKKRNWQDDFEFNKPCSNEKIKNKGLKTEFESIDIKFKITDETAVDIQEETSEENIWDTFKIVFDQLDPEDEIVFDITHGFRSSPMLLMVLINYAKFLKKITIRKIVYGAFEARDRDKNETKIWDLTNFAVLQDWTSAIGNFIKHGDAEEIQKMTKAYGQKQKKKQLYEKYANQFDKIAKCFQTVRGKELVKAEIFEKVIKLSNELKEDVELPMLRQLISRVAQNMSIFKNDNINNGFIAIDWTFEHKLIQQSYTLLQEMVKTCLCELWKGRYYFSFKKKADRELISSAISMHSQKDGGNSDNWHGDLGRRKEVGIKVFNEPVVKELSRVFFTLTEARNSMNHGGFTGDISEKNFYDNFTKYYKLIIDILSNYGIYYQSKILK